MLNELIFVAPEYYVNLEELCEYRGYKKGKLAGLGIKQMAVLYKENLIDLAVRALKKTNIKDTSLLILSTESSEDLSKPLSVKITDKFGLNECITFETKFACRAGLDSVLMAYSYSKITGNKSIVVCLDEAIYEKGNAEYTGGCGCAVIVIDPQSQGLDLDLPNAKSYVADIDDFYKPMSITPVVDGKLSIIAYLYCCKNAVESWKKVKNQKVTEYFDKLVFHVPFPSMVRWISAVLYAYERKDKVEVHIEDVMKDFSLFDKWRKERKQIENEEKFRQWFNEKVEPSLRFHPYVGNSYTASIWLALISTLVNSEINIEDKIGLCGYGSGAGSICVEAIVKDKVKVKYELPKKKLDIDKYIEWRKERGIEDD